MEESKKIALTKWREDLATYRQDWPEWEELEAIAAEDNWTWTESTGSGLLIHDVRPLSIRPIRRTYYEIPKYAIAIGGLRPSNDPARFTHPVFGLIDYGYVDEDHAGIFPDLRYMTALIDMAALQLCETGNLVVLVNGIVYRSNGSEFREVGPIDLIARYALRCTLDGKLWIHGALVMKYKFEEFGLADDVAKTFLLP